MGSVVDQRVLHNGMRGWLATATARQVGLLDPPGNKADPSYLIIIPITAGRGEGSFFDPEEDRDWVYQVSSYAPSKDEIFWQRTLVAEAFLGRTSSGVYQHPIVIPGVNVQWRLSDSSGAIIPSGVSSYEGQDTYRIRTGV